MNAHDKQRCSKNLPTFAATSYQVTKKLGAASILEDMNRNKEYFANLQKCYNPSVEFGDFTRFGLSLVQTDHVT